MTLKRGRHSRFVAHLPCDREGAATLRDLAARSGLPLDRWAAWATTTAKRIPGVQRRNVSPHGTPTYAYWREA